MPQTALPLEHCFVDESAHTAYQRIIPLENSDTKLIRLLGWMLIHAPSETGRADVAQSINKCQTNEAIFETGRYYLKYFIKYFKTLTDKPMPSPSTNPSRTSMDARRDEILSSIAEAPTSHSEAKDRALVRDNYRCQLSGVVDIRSFMGSSRLQAELASDPTLNLQTTRCFHILPQHICHDAQISGEGRTNSATIWSVVETFGGIPLSNVNGAEIHHLRNILTLQESLHAAFDNLWIWLEPLDEQEHTYSIRRRYPAIHSDLPSTVTFTTNADLDLPDRRYLALHAACAKVLYLSGTVEVIDSVLRDLEDVKVLSQDGVSAELLDYLLFTEFPMIA